MPNMCRYNRATYGIDHTTCQYEYLCYPTCAYHDWINNTHAISNLFGATAFKTAVKRYHQQPDCTDLLEVVSRKAARTRETGDYVQQFREERRVIQGCLIHRLQSVCVLRKFLITTPSRRDPPSGNNTHTSSLE
jgi:hypothetical protein